MPKLTSMKREAGEVYCCEDQNRYGYGLQINLDEDQCEALGITKPMRPGSQVSLSAMGIVVRASECLERDGDDKGTDVQISIQITDLAVTPQGMARNAAEQLYGSD